MSAISPKPITDELLIEAFSQPKLQEAFDYVSLKKTRGIDGTTVDKFLENKQDNLDLIKQKCLKGTYKFSPYLQKLQMKGKGKAPRVISIATIRDRVVLHVIKNLLQQAFPESVNRKLPNNYVKSINDFFSLSRSGRENHDYQRAARAR
jgi:retron-type reverse transcriptase